MGRGKTRDVAELSLKFGSREANRSRHVAVLDEDAREFRLKSGRSFFSENSLSLSHVSVNSKSGSHGKVKWCESSGCLRFRRSSAPADNCNNLCGITNRLFKKDTTLGEATSHAERKQADSLLIPRDKLCLKYWLRVPLYLFFLFFFFF